MANNRIFVNSATLLKANFAGGTDSDNFNVISELNQSGSLINGNSQVRRIGLPSTWATADISFIVYEDNSFENGKILYITDGADNIPLVLTACIPSSTISLQAPWLDSVNYFQIISSVAQAALEVDVICEPLFQVIA